MERIETRTMFISEDDNSIIRMEIREGAAIDIDDAADNILVVKNLSKGLPRLKLVDSRVSWKITDDAKKYLEEEDDPKRTLARAVLQSSHIEKWITSFLLRINKPETPVKFFTNEQDAIKWLISFK